MKNNYDKHFLIGLGIGALFAIFTRDLSPLAAAFISAFITLFPAVGWEWYWNKENNAPISKGDIIVSVLGGFVGGLLTSLIF